MGIPPLLAKYQKNIMQFTLLITLFLYVSMIDESTQRKIASMADVKADAPSSTPAKDDSTWAALSREAYVVGGGLADGFKDNLNAQSLIERAPDFLMSAGIGASLALAQGKSGLIKLGAEVVGLSFGVGFVKDIAKPERIDGLSTAIGNTWRSGDNLDYNRAQVKKHGGDFVFDTTIMAAGGMFGASSVKMSRSESVAQLKSVVTNGVESARKRFSLSEIRAGLAGKSEVVSGSLGAVETSLGSAGRTHAGSQSLLETRLGATRTEGGSTSLATGPREGHLPSTQVLPEGQIAANVNARRLPDNADKLPLADIHKGETIPWEIAEGKTVTWETSKEGVGVRLLAQKWVDAFMDGRYTDALKVAVEAPVMERVNLNPTTRPHTVTVSAADLKQPEVLQLRMGTLSNYAEFKWQQTMKDGHIEGSKLEVVIPKAIIELNDGTTVPFVDFVRHDSGKYSVVFPEKSVAGKDLSPAQVAEIRALRQSPEGQRLMAETSIFGYEETIVHANQHITQGGRITSPTFAEFAADFASQSPSIRGHRLAFLNALDQNHQARPTILEQEVPVLAYDAGMPLSVVRHHFFFGDRHVARRTPVMEFLRNRELLTKPIE